MDKETLELNTLRVKDLINVYTIFHTTVAKHILLINTQNTIFQNIFLAINTRFTNLKNEKGRKEKEEKTIGQYNL